MEGLECGVAETELVRFGYARAGHGPPVLLLPGSGGWELTFHALLPQLAVDHTVYAVDPPGQGGTRVVSNSFGYDVDAIVQSLVDFLDAVGLSEVIVVGHSWGGGFALRLVELFPDRIRRLVLLAPAGLTVRDVWEFRALRVPVVGEVAARFTTNAAVRHMLHKSFVDADRLPSPELTRTAARTLRSRPGLRRDLLRVERTVKWTATERDLGLVRSPVLIVWGARDRYFPVRLIDRFTSALPHVRTEVIADAGHSVHDDRPAQAVPLVRQFLTGTSRTTLRDEARQR
ncbi:2-succinyl-6-hydroxy-2,4-cyclohexadiene-1-carboxy late synthase [Kribbella sancticallisti]|uniref:2-succinyl-6-hydroxy-2, 4-cyclohexadiene-1-carboxy late synthase n=1 Tax=Kribbella sancticallisti TaxID=460087 RepID=A0ABN2DME2_9ACTN